jgi:hypothetical protein
MVDPPAAAVLVEGPTTANGFVDAEPPFAEVELLG